ncbi:MAG TPA: hypothetical protein PKO31_03170 [Methanofastidiosum sp.]|nr:hypothetical protein [Methanofastidiosum sp.]HQK62595.1 hypothetical protein [Methanofastidiosum sp.]
MIKNETLNIVKELEFDKKQVIFNNKTESLYIFRPSELSKRFQDYDVNKNFQIWLIEGNREFRPNHLRILIDLNLRTRSRPDLKKDLLLAFDNIYYGNDPEKEIENIKKEKFDHYLNSIDIIANLAQLLLVEQEYCYNKESYFDPPTLFLQGWIRQFMDSHKEIDNLCMSVANRQPPNSKYTWMENKKHKKYCSIRKSLWYLDEILDHQEKLF